MKALKNIKVVYLPNVRELHTAAVYCVHSFWYANAWFM